MKNPLIRLLAALVATAAALGTLTACGPHDGPGISESSMTGIVYAVRENSPTVTADELYRILDESVKHGSFVDIYSSEGTPRQIWSGEVTYSRSAQKVKKAREGALQTIVDAVMAYEPTSDEANPLEAAMLIAGDFADREGEKQIIVLDNLLQTQGAVALQEAGTLYAEPADVAQSLTDSGYLTDDFAGSTVVLTSLGTVPVGSAQPVLDSAARKQLSSFWSALFEAGGATVETDTVAPATPSAELPPVSIVPIAPVAPVSVGCTLSLSGSQLSFEPDSGNFSDVAASTLVIEQAAAALLASGCEGQVSLTGTTSSAGTAATRESVSGKRIDTVRPLLAQALGIDPAAITTRAAGYDTAFCAPDRDASGALVLSLAAACRLVVISVGTPS